MKFDCPHCSQRLEAPQELLGQQIGCPNCEGLIQVPAPLEAPAPDLEALTREGQDRSQVSDLLNGMSGEFGDDPVCYVALSVQGGAMILTKRRFLLVRSGDGSATAHSWDELADLTLDSPSGEHGRVERKQNGSLAQQFASAPTDIACRLGTGAVDGIAGIPRKQALKVYEFAQERVERIRWARDGKAGAHPSTSAPDWGLEAYALDPWFFVGYGVMIAGLLAFGMDPRYFLFSYLGELMLVVAGSMAKPLIVGRIKPFVGAIVLSLPVLIGLPIATIHFFLQLPDTGATWSPLIVLVVVASLLVDRVQLFRKTTLKSMKMCKWLNAHYVLLADGKEKKPYSDPVYLGQTVVAAYGFTFLYCAMLFAAIYAVSAVMGRGPFPLEFPVAAAVTLTLIRFLWGLTGRLILKVTKMESYSSAEMLSASFSVRGLIVRKRPPADWSPEDG